MELDDELCLCFHVTKRKVINYLRIERPQRVASSPIATARDGLRLVPAVSARSCSTRPKRRTSRRPSLPSPDEYAHARGDYVRAGKGTPPPGATPIESAMNLSLARLRFVRCVPLRR